MTRGDPKRCPGHGPDATVAAGGTAGEVPRGEGVVHGTLGTGGREGPRGGGVGGKLVVFAVDKLAAREGGIPPPIFETIMTLFFFRRRFLYCPCFSKFLNFECDLLSPNANNVRTKSCY